MALELSLALDFGACSPEMSLTCGVAAAGGDKEGQETIITYAPPAPLATHLALHQIPPVQCLLRSLLEEGMIS